jgi:hypothetical protein
VGRRGKISFTLDFDINLPKDAAAGMSCGEASTRSAMKTKLLLFFGLSLCYLGEQTMGQTVPGSPPNADPDRLRAIVQAGAQKIGTKAVMFGMWVRDREILTTVLGNSMTTVPATTDMHCLAGP